MQAQKSAVPEMQCKDKFLIQTTVVPFGTTEEEITPGMVGYHYSGLGLVVCVLFGIVCCSWKLKVSIVIFLMAVLKRKSKVY